MKTIFHIITHLDLGGGERVALNIAESDNKEFEYHIVEVVRGKSKFTESILKELNDKNVIYHRAPLSTNNKLAILIFPFWFLFLILRNTPNIIHSHTEVPDLSVYLFYRLFGWLFPRIKYIRTIHNTVLWSKWEKIGYKVERFFIKQKANISISLSTQECYNKIYFNKPPLIYNGVNETIQEKYSGIQANKINILFAGRFEEQKGINELIAVIKEISNIDKYFFHIIGAGSLYQKIQSELGQLKNVVICDKIYGLSRYIGSFDYLFMPSNFEGLVLTSIEASLAKTPVIANNCLGLNETLPENWPLLVQNNDVNQYLYILKNIIPHINRNELGEIAYKYVSNKFSMFKMRDEYEKLYSLI